MLGLYLLCPEPNFAGASAQLLSLLGEVQQELEGGPSCDAMLLYLYLKFPALLARCLRRVHTKKVARGLACFSQGRCCANATAADKGANGLLLLHIDAVGGKLAAREFTGGAAGSLKPCELKSGSLLPSLVAVHCRYACMMSATRSKVQESLHLHPAA